MSSSHNSEHASHTVLFMLASFVLLAIVIWFEFSTQINQMVIIGSKATFELMQWLYHLGSIGPDLTKIFFGDMYADIEFMHRMQENYYTLNPKEMSATEMYVHLNYCGLVLRWISVIICPILILQLWRSSKVQRLKRRFNLQDLLWISADEFPHLRPSLLQNLLDKDPDIGLYRREECPIRFGIKKGLITVYKRNRLGEIKSNVGYLATFSKKNNSSKSILIKDHFSKGISKIHKSCELDSNKTKQVFIKQLGKKFTHYNKLSDARKSLLAVFITFAQGQEAKDEAFELLNQFNRSWTPDAIHNEDATQLIKTNKPFLDMTGVDEKFEKYWNTEIIQEVINCHAYETTVMQAMLEVARRKGKLWDCFWYWIKPIDRVMWWSLDQEGGHTAWSESAGPRAHLLAERKLNIALQVPYVETAVLTFKSELEKDGWLIQQSELSKFNEIAEEI